jgi:hypothetical protein
MACGRERRWEREAYRHWYFWKFPGWKACVTLYVCWAVVKVESKMSVASWKCIVPARKREACALCDSRDS